MDPEVEQLLERRFRIPEDSGEKVRPLADAVAEHVRPGDTVHLGLTHTRGSAAAWELIRRFRHEDPGFTLCGVQVTTPAAPLVHAGLARKIVTSWAGDSYWTPGPNPVYQRAWEGGVEFEHWSILTYSQRLAAAARGHAWTTTRSLAGSDLAARLAPHAYREIEPGLALIPALVPDVSIFHAPAADAQGNVLMTPPLMENVSGALAARRGAIVTVDRVVDSSFVRDHGYLGRIPSHAVAAVVEAPLGGHPGGMLPRGLDGIEGYGEDYEFWVDIRSASRDPAAMDAWIKEWVLECPTHDEYLRRLGGDRIAELRRRARPDTWREDLEAALPAADLDAATYSPLEMAIAAAARVIAARVRERSYTTMLAGAGMANLAAWLAAFELAEGGTRVDLAAEMGLVGYWPRAGEPMLFNQRNFWTCTMLADIDFTLGVLVGGANARSIGSLGAAQVDRAGNINSTEIPGERLLMGSGGANDVATCASETVVCVVQAPGRMPERVAYVTAPGDRIRTVVSTAGVYEKEGDELVLVAVFGDDADAAVRAAVQTCGWEPRVARGVALVPPPTREELRTLRLIDPQGWFRT